MKKTLLLADDSPTIQKVINLTFADEGIDVIAVGDGNAAIQQLRELKPDLVMADVHMPGLNGYQICERIRQNAELSKVPVILLVGSFEPFDEEEAKRVGADDFLMKPFQSIRQLVGRVAALLDANAQPGSSETPAADAGIAQESPAMHISDTPSITPKDIFSSPWTETAVIETAETVEVPESAESAEITETAEAELSAPPPATAEITEEVDDLSDFDSEFEQKFPDAAALSSEFSFSRPQADVAHEETPPETRFEAAAAEEPVEEPMEESVEDAARGLLPVEEANVTFSDAPERIWPERIWDELDDVEEKTPPVSETASILDLGLDLGHAYAPTGPVDDDVLLDIKSDETDQKHDDDTLVFNPAETVPAEKTEEGVFVDAPTEIASSEIAPPEITSWETAAAETAAPETAQYDFRAADAFDDDRTIEESFQGMPRVEEPYRETSSVPMERILDTEPGEVSEDQADGFSAAPAPEAPAAPAVEAAPAQPQQQISPEAIEAIAQRVLEKLTAKLVKDMAPEMRNIIMNEISGEDAPKE